MGKIIQVLKIAAAAVVVSIILLLLGAFISYKLRLSDAQISLFAAAIYAVGAFIAGFGTGRLKKEKRLLWAVCRSVILFCYSPCVDCLGNGTALRCRQAYKMCDNLSRIRSCWWNYRIEK